MAWMILINLTAFITGVKWIDSKPYTKVGIIFLKSNANERMRVHLLQIIENIHIKNFAPDVRNHGKTRNSKKKWDFIFAPANGPRMIVAVVTCNYRSFRVLWYDSDSTLEQAPLNATPPPPSSRRCTSGAAPATCKSAARVWRHIKLAWTLAHRF